MKKTLLITGATGHQGSATLRALLDMGGDWRYRVMTRNPDSEKAQHLKDQGVEVVQGDFDDKASLQAALQDVYGVYSVTTMMEKGGTDAEIRQGKSMASAAAQAGIQHYVFSSVGGADRKSGVPHFESKWEIEEHIRSLGLPATIIRPVIFMDNFKSFGFRFMVLSMIKTFVPDSKPVQIVAVRDVGRIAALAFHNPGHYIGATIELAGDEMTRAQMQAVMKRNGLSHQALKFPSFIAKKMPSNFTGMFQWFADVGYDADIQKLRAIYPELMTFADFLNDLKQERAKL